MLNRLRLENFRRHALLELSFDGDAQVILIAGSNGAGKSTVLEGIHYALWGESRHGRRHLDTLVRRGAELEGMEAELEFEVAGANYLVHRRRDNKNSTAVLYANGTSIVEGPVQVSEEVARILGMDSVGFKLATVAQQNELDGLASLRPAERAAQIRRLLRLDALTAAADEARALFRREREIANSLTSDVDPKALEEALEAAAKAVQGAQEARRLTRESLVEIEASLAASNAVEEAWHHARREVARAEGLLSGARDEVARLRGELDSIVVPPEVRMPERSIESLANDLSELERKLARGESARQMASQRDMLTSELAAANSRLAGLRSDLTNHQAAAELLVPVEDELTEVRSAREDLSARREELREQFADAQSRERLAAEALSRAGDLEATCSHCGQEVTAEHRERQEAQAREELGVAEERARALRAAGLEVVATLSGAQTRLGELEERVRALRGSREAAGRLEREVGELERRASTYASQLERMVVEEVDVDELYAQKAELAILVSAAQQATDQERARNAVLVRRHDLRDKLEAAQGRMSDAEALREASAVDAELEASYAKRAEVLERREDERAMEAHWETSVAVAERDHLSATRALEVAQKAEARRLTHQGEAVRAANASRVLKDVADRLASQIRPALEGSVSQLLGTLSEGRFASVSIDADYNIRVEDDGALRPLGEFSGGEIDLIALAMRLALAQVVSERHGSGGTGFLILDEVFGSQDGERREAILTALRTLRGTYGQIFLISHVGGLEEAADMLVEVSRSSDGSSEVKSS